MEGIRRFFNQYVDGFDSCHRVNSSTQKPFGTLEPLPIPVGLWIEISYEFLSNLPESRLCDSILTAVNRLTKIEHFLHCRNNTNAEQLLDLMAEHAWKLHGTPKTIFTDKGSKFVLQITQKLKNQMGIQLHPSAYQPRCDGQLEIANKSVEQYLRHFTYY